MEERGFEWLKSISGPLALACLGASLQCLRGEWRGWKNFIISNMMAAFSAIICMSILPHYVNFDVAAGVTGIVGYSGGSLIDSILARIHHEIRTREPAGGRTERTSDD